jgi:hypothetical protein
MDYLDQTFSTLRAKIIWELLKLTDVWPSEMNLIKISRDKARY